MLKPKFNLKAIEAYINKRKEDLELAIVQELQIVGEEFVTNARNNGEYNDITGNLRNSIYYTIYKDGHVYLGNKIEEHITDEGTVFTGYDEEFVKQFPSGFVLVCRAGMSYAFYVETGYRGDREDGEPMFVTPKDVISGSALIAQAALQQALENLKERANK